MSLKDFQVFKAACFIPTPFSTQWSQDNIIATSTDKGVHVVQLKFGGAKGLPVIDTHRWFIKPRDATPTAEIGINTNTMLRTLPMRDVFLYMVDPTLSPRAPLSGLNPSIRSSAWSYYQGNVHDSCLLGVLTDLGSLDLYALENEDWIMKSSISDLWLAFCRKQWDAAEGTNGTELFKILKQRACKVKIVAFVWSKSLDDTHTFIISSNMVGEVTIWQVSSMRYKIEADHLNTIKTDLDYGSSLSCETVKDGVILLVGCRSGRIQCFKIDTNGNQIRRSLVWSDIDMLQPGPAIFMPNAPRGLIFLSPKGSHILALWIDDDATVIDFVIHDSEDISVTGSTLFDNNCALMSTCSGELIKISCNTNDNNLEITVKHFQSPQRSKAYTCNGIAASKNAAITAIAYSLSAPYDHLALRDHCQILLCHDPGSIDPNEVLRKETTSLYNDWDYLEILRVESVIKGQEPSFHFDPEDSVGHMAINKLRKAYWLLKFSTSINSSKERSAELNKICKEMKFAIISHFLFQRLSFISSDSLTSTEQSDLNIALKWLENLQNTLSDDYQPTKTMANIMHQQLISFVDEENETCPFCESPCSFADDELLLRCTSDHEVPRCMFTLLPVHRIPYYHCIQCGELAVSLDFPGLDLMGHCVICDGKLKAESCLENEF